MSLLNLYLPLQRALDNTRIADGIAPLLIRLYLAPVLIQAGWNKFNHFDDTVAWFGNPDWGLGLPFPVLMASLAIAAELGGACLMLIGLATRWVAIPLMITMLVAAFTAHWQNGWLAIADASSWLADGTLFLNESVMAAPEKLAAANYLLKEHGNYDWLTSSGKFVILNNGIEFAATYFVMLLVLFFTGGGRFTSVDYFLARHFMKNAK
ncbi:DoxX family protein [Aliiglaciecola sp. CAU 1673]|uniref:HvfX family Cu-binding RiPP maturation protein n=1 Tax=Aliiglaciecola sp. CAU 1673 TaxID=3032595 RepID=UPI0023DB7071|nr:DoxX family protein [Aliiglaciecola sp. CAU 1673]MDF2180414.1 DoxX family protein [Aliiglaciecola sp. CAU 1673]